MSRNSLPDVSECPPATPVYTDLLAGLKVVCLECVRAPPRGVGRTWPAGAGERSAGGFRWRPAEVPKGQSLEEALNISSHSAEEKTDLVRGRDILICDLAGTRAQCS